ncbi:MAG: extracellular solute-binding protein [Oscillospiraceae bacterium]|nr:extracellular solute-binding protein [Oscillospiraceae bacterium]
MKINIKRFLSVFVICIFILVSLLSCNRDNNINTGRENENTRPPTENSEITATEAVNEKILPDLPENDFNGHEFTYFIWDVTEWAGNEAQCHRDLYSEGETGEIVNDAVFRRNVKIEDQYNIRFKQSFALISQYESKLKKAIAADAAEFDVLLYQTASMGSLVSKGYLRNIYDLQYADFTKPWWEKNSIKDLSIDNKLFGINSAITLVDKMGAQTLLFNKELLKNYSLDDPYQMVINGIWTIDKFGEMVKTVSKDLNGDGTMDSNDQFGLLCIRDSMSNFANGCECFIAQKDKDDRVVLTFAGDRQYSAYEKILDIFLERNSAYNYFMRSPNDWETAIDRMFQGSQALFMWTRMRDCEALRAMETSFGILPVPKYDAQQSRYYSSINPYTSTIIGIPVSNTDMERTGIILEALAAESLYTVQPAYYDITLQSKIARDFESEKMLDIIYDNVCYDIGEILGLGNLNEYVYLVDQENRNVASFYEKKEGKALLDIDKIMDIVLNLDIG